MTENPLEIYSCNLCLLFYNPVQEEKRKRSNSQSHRYHEVVEGFSY